jgi:hypothetical protein
MFFKRAPCSTARHKEGEALAPHGHAGCLIALNHVRIEAIQPHEPQYRVPEQASNPVVQTQDFLPAWQVHYENAPSTEPIALRRVRRAQVYPAVSQNRRLKQSPTDALIDTKVWSRLRRQIPVWLDWHPVIHLRINSGSGSNFTPRALGAGGSAPAYYFGAPRFVSLTFRTDF